MWFSVNKTLSSFCSSPFWDNNLTWNTSDPDFTICFEKTILTWLPCAFLWVSLPFQISRLRTRCAIRSPYLSSDFFKLVTIIILVVISLLDTVVYFLVEEMLAAVDIYTPLMKFLTFGVFFCLMYANIKFGITSSRSLSMFLSVLVFNGAPQFRTEIRMLYSSTSNKTANQEILVKRVLYLIHYAVVIFVFLLNCFTQTSPVKEYESVKENTCPEMHSSFMSRVFFSWCDKLVWKGYKHEFVDRDIWELDYDLRAATNAKKFESKWNRLLEENRRKQVKHRHRTPDENQRLLISGTRTESATEVSLVRPLLEIFGKDVVLAFGLRMVHQLLQVLVTPLSLSLILMLFEDDTEFEWHGYFYVLILLVSEFIQGPLFNHFKHINYRAESSICAALMMAIYKKALKISNSARKNYATGEIVNLMAVDVQKLFGFITNVTFFLIYISYVFICVFLLWNILGPCVLAGIAVIMAYVIVNSLIISEIQILQKQHMTFKDKRNRLINEILAGIKVLKLSAYEPCFERQINELRNREIASLKRASYYSVGAEVMSTLSSVLVPVVTFGLYVLSNDENVLNARNVFVSLSLFNILKLNTRIFPGTANSVLQGAVAIKRIRAFLNSEELSNHAVTHEQCSEPVVIQHGKFSWDGYQATSILRGINLKVKAGSLVAVIGPVGAGKSSLLSAILGDMYKQSGSVNTTGRLAYVPQQAWIRNTTLRNNITFGDATKSSFYDTIIEACALIPDLRVLPDGDQTEIGEKGINLSGGQKQRVSLARAVYSDADIHLLDDPLSAVDSHVSKHIFEKVIGPKGLLKNKTRIFVTHNIRYLSYVDYIIVLGDGSISEHGTYEELLKRETGFANLLTQLKKNEESQNKNGNPDDIHDDQKIEEKLLIRREIGSKYEDGTEVDKVKFELTKLEKKETGNVKFTVMTYYLKAFGLFLIILTTASVTLSQAFSISADYWLSKWSNDANGLQSINGHGNEDGQRAYLSIYGFLNLGNVFSMIVFGSAMYKGMIKASKYIHNHLLISVLHWPVLAFDRTPCGQILNRFGRDVDILDNLLPTSLLALVCCVAKVVSSFFVISFNTPSVLSVILPSLAIYYVIQIIFSATSKQLKRMESISKSPIYSHFTDTITGANSIRAYNLEEKFIQESEEKFDANIKQSYACWVAYRWMDIRTQLLSAVIVLATCLFLMQAKDSIGVAIVGLSITYSLQLNKDFYWSLFLGADVEMKVIAVERIKEFSEIEQEALWIVPDVDQYIPESWPNRGEISFFNLQARYHEELEPILHGITLQVRGCEKVGIVGRTGAGKSSLTLCLFRIIEVDKGSILIDGIDISRIGLRKLRSRMTIIPQDPVLFSGTLRMNLDPEEKYLDDEIWRALELVNLKTLVSGLQADLNYEVDEGGRNFSVGQRQLISLARALLRKTKILILDEATAAIDFETDKVIQVTIKKEFADCTVLTIAHRLNTILDYDRVMVLDKGRIVEFDSPQGLLESKQSMFYAMALKAGLA